MDLKSIIWHDFHPRRRSYFFIWVMYKSCTFLTLDLGFDYRVDKIGTILNNVVMDKKEYDRHANLVWNKAKEKKDFLENFYQRIYKLNEEHNKRWKEINSQDLQKKSSQELAKNVQEYINDLFEYATTWLIPLSFEKQLSNFVKDQVTKEEYDLISHPQKESSIIQEVQELTKIKTEKELTQHWKKWRWLKNKGFREEYYNIDYFKERWEKQKEQGNKTQNKEQEEKAKQFKELLEKYKDKNLLTTMIKALNEGIYFRNIRTDMVLQSPDRVRNLITEFCKRLDLTEKDWIWLNPKELVSAITTNQIEGTLRESIEKRKKAFIYIARQEEQDFFKEGEEAITAGKGALDTNNTVQKELRGSPAYQGIVEGTAVVVLSKEDFKKIEEGHILITPSTTPDYVPYLDKVKGIVTEEGGILSHASVISRELKIPTIIGTKGATKAFKTGDEVFLDAKVGSIKKQ